MTAWWLVDTISTRSNLGWRFTDTVHGERHRHMESGVMRSGHYHCWGRRSSQRGFAARVISDKGATRVPRTLKIRLATPNEPPRTAAWSESFWDVPFPLFAHWHIPQIIAGREQKASSMVFRGCEDNTMRSMFVISWCSDRKGCGALFWKVSEPSSLCPLFSKNQPVFLNYTQYIMSMNTKYNSFFNHLIR